LPHAAVDKDETALKKILCITLIVLKIFGLDQNIADCWLVQLDKFQSFVCLAEFAQPLSLQSVTH
jgi:hypothetical protein